MGKITGFIELQRISEVALPDRASASATIASSCFALDGRSGVEAGRALHGLRHPVLPVRLPGQQYHSRLERPGLPAAVARGARRAALDQQFPRVHRANLPRALRGRLHAQHQRRSGRHQVDRALHHRQGLGRRLGRAAAAAEQDRQARRGRRLRPGGHGVRAAARARRATTSCCSRRATASAGCCATAFPISRWRSTTSTGASSRCEPKASSSAPTSHVGTWTALARRSCSREFDAVVLDRRRRAAARP